jgi:polyhydroxybutyrate depolymerase
VTLARALTLVPTLVAVLVPARVIAQAVPASIPLKISVDGVTRDYRLFRPAGISGKQAPVVIMLHGGLGTASNIEEYLGLSAVAAASGFVAVYPQGLSRAWNDARPNKALMSPNASKADDVAFLNRLTDDLIAKGIADSKRVYLAGLSNGGFMTMRMACEASSRFAAFATVIASAPVQIRETCRPARALPVLMIAGTGDKLVKFEASTAAAQGNLGAVNLADFWAGHNGCKGSTDSALPDLDPADNSAVVVRRYTDCQPQGDVEMITVRGGGHQPPSRGRVRDYPLLRGLLGVRNHDIDTATAFWDFFKQHSL